MSKKLEELFDLPPTQENVDVSIPAIPENKDKLEALDDIIDKIDHALPMVRGLEASDSEMDELALLATKSYKDLLDLGFQVDSRFASEIFSVASNMLGHAITAKTAKMDKKLKMIDLQLKKMRLDQQGKNSEGPDIIPTAQGTVLSRNDLLERILASNKENTKRE
jgi:hypothetical protein